MGRVLVAVRAMIDKRKVQDGHGFRPDIQGLRAVAVGVVVLFHLWPEWVGGGYVGVDVFFVISGFLITSHLWREARERGTIALGRFYARRALRLLPAAVLVLACTAVASMLILPEARWEDTFRQTVASAAYVENWLLAHNSVDYLLQYAPDSPVQHYWSLSVEEQFYAIWPILIIATIWVVARFRRHDSPPLRYRAVMIALSTLLLASLAYSIYETAVLPKQAYFITPTRVWEFATGALCGLLVLDAQRWFRARMMLGWLGMAAILAASLFYSKATAFPGYAALLPVLGTAAVILGAQAASPWSASWWLSLRPATEIGDISYAVYLWHWPLLTLVPIALDAPLDKRVKLPILAATLALAWLSTHLYENPLRRNGFLRVRRWPSLGFALGGVAAMVAMAVISSSIFTARVAAAEADWVSRTVAPGNPCYGAATFDRGANCPSVAGEGPLMPVALAIKDQGNREYAKCDSWLSSNEVFRCDFGPDDAAVKVAFVGDSHALHWLGAIQFLARQGRWHATTYFKMSCPFADAIRVIPSEPKEWQQACVDWQQEVERRLVADTSLQYVVVTAYSHAYNLVPPGGGAPDATWADRAWRSMWQKLIDSGKKVVVVRDTPSTLSMSIPECVQREIDDLLRCAVPRDKALPYDQISQSALNARDPNIMMIDLTDGFCDREYCYAVVGDLIVYRDTNHLTWQYAESLAPRFWSEFAKAISGPPPAAAG